MSTPRTSVETRGEGTGWTLAKQNGGFVGTVALFVLVKSFLRQTSSPTFVTQKGCRIRLSRCIAATCGQLVVETFHFSKTKNVWTTLHRNN